ncbi:MAG: class I SAM-dependent methyltransferase [Vicinamibacterales bacterium]
MTDTPADLRPAPVWRRALRLAGHRSPRYLFHRVRAILRARLHPDEPSLTPAAVARLATAIGPGHRGAEWGSGNSTRWLAARAGHLTSFETDPGYYRTVAAALRAAGLDNVDYRQILFEDSPDEEAMHRSAWVQAAHAFADGSLDFALVDSSPRGCLCAALVPKLRPGGLLVLDNANWYLPPPAGVRPPAPGSVAVGLGRPGSRVPENRCWPRFVDATADWPREWTSDGVQMTAIFVKP